MLRTHWPRKIFVFYLLLFVRVLNDIIPRKLSFRIYLLSLQLMLCHLAAVKLFTVYISVPNHTNNDHKHEKIDGFQLQMLFQEYTVEPR